MEQEFLQKRYRRNVAVMVINSNGEILACRRSDMENVWQIPQGGIEENETVEEAALRELTEEIGTAEVEIIGQLPLPLRYDWPEALYERGYHGQEQIYFLARIKENTRIELTKNKEVEFDAYKWVGAREFMELLSGFKAPVYREALDKLQQYFPGHIAP